MADDGVDITEERAEDAESRFQRECLGLLTQANRMAAFDTADALAKSTEIAAQLAEARKRGWHGVETFHAMHALLCANLMAYTYDNTPGMFELMCTAYTWAIQDAAHHAEDPLYHLRAKRAFAAMLVSYTATPAQAHSHLVAIFEAFQPPKDADQDQRDKYEKLRDSYEDLWVQTITQLAEVEWLLGNPQEAHKLLDSIVYPDNINMYHVAAMILHAQLCWRTGQRRRGAQLAKRAAQDVHRVANHCHASSLKRARLLRRPWLGGMWRYRRAFGKLRCPRI